MLAQPHPRVSRIAMPEHVPLPLRPVGEEWAVVKVLQGLGSLGLAAVAVWVLMQVPDPLEALTAGAGFGLLVVAWVVRPKKSRQTGSHAGGSSQRFEEDERRSVFDA